MMVSGLFFCGGATALFGLLQHVPLPAVSDNNMDVTYLIFAIVIRLAQAVGAAAFLVGGMSLLAIAFPINTTTVLVGIINPKYLNCDLLENSLVWHANCLLTHYMAYMLSTFHDIENILLFSFCTYVHVCTCITLYRLTTRCNTSHIYFIALHHTVRITSHCVTYVTPLYITPHWIIRLGDWTTEWPISPNMANINK